VGEERYSSTILDLGTRWRCDQFRILTILFPGKELPGPNQQDAGWFPELVWMPWRREKSLALLEIKT
jgi:hypothetical protein